MLHDIESHRVIIVVFDFQDASEKSHKIGPVDDIYRFSCASSHTRLVRIQITHFYFSLSILLLIEPSKEF